MEARDRDTFVQFEWQSETRIKCRKIKFPIGIMAGEFSVAQLRRNIASNVVPSRTQRERASK